MTVLFVIIGWMLLLGMCTDDDYAEQKEQDDQAHRDWLNSFANPVNCDDYKY